eukprot:5452256-Pyramimonas_sp.AAC.1
MCKGCGPRTYRPFTSSFDFGLIQAVIPSTIALNLALSVGSLTPPRDLQLLNAAKKEYRYTSDMWSEGNGTVLSRSFVASAELYDSDGLYASMSIMNRLHRVIMRPFLL